MSVQSILLPHLFPSPLIPPLLLPFSCPPGSEGEELHPLQDRGEHQEEGAGVRQGVQTQRRSAAAHRQQQEERGTHQHAGSDKITSNSIHEKTSKTSQVSSVLPGGYGFG